MNSEVSLPLHCLANQAFKSAQPDRIFLQKTTPFPHREGQLDPYFLDEYYIDGSKGFRRLKYKTQVFYDRENPHIRDRSAHTLEVKDNASMISQLLGLNTHLVAAQAAGHDLGHAPVGHLFEQVTKDLGLPEFRHERFSAIVATCVERGGDGLGLTRATLQGIYEHSRGSKGFSQNGSFPECDVVAIADKISYITADINDIIRKQMMTPKDLQYIESLLPGNQRSKIDLCIDNLIIESAAKGRVSFSDSIVAQNFVKLRQFLYEQYYSKLNTPEMINMIKNSYDQIDGVHDLEKYDKTMLLALMTDSELKKVAESRSLGRLDLGFFTEFGVYEIIQQGFLEGQTYTDLDQRVYQAVYSA